MRSLVSVRWSPTHKDYSQLLSRASKIRATENEQGIQTQVDSNLYQESVPPNLHTRVFYTKKSSGVCTNSEKTLHNCYTSLQTARDQLGQI